MADVNARFLSGRETVLLRDALEAYQPVLMQRAGILARVGRGEGVEEDAHSISALLEILDLGAHVAVVAPRMSNPAFCECFKERVA